MMHVTVESSPGAAAGQNAAERAPTRAERKKDELRREIIDAAFEEFANRGYHATGIADIATRLGIGHGTFYRYFENKRDIIDHVITDLVTRISSGLVDENAPEAANSLEEYRAQVARIGASLTRVFSEDPRIPRVLLFEATGIDAQLTDRILSFLDTVAAMTGAYLRHGVEGGYLRPDLDVDNTARVINGMILATIIQGLRNPGANELAMSIAIERLMYEGIVGR
jgi:AcrR family transcriptional regulator